MATKPAVSGKRLAIVKANARNVATVGAAAFITIFCLMASKAIWNQNQYLGRVIKAKTAANSQLLKNVTAANKLNQSFAQFQSFPSNVLGGNPQGSGPNDGDNAKIVLDALPSQYDFPALTASLEAILKAQNLNGSISGTDDQLNQQTNTVSASPQPVSVPFGVNLTETSYDAVQKFINKLQSSIRPMQIDNLNINGATNSMTVSISAHTYYQPGKSLSITTEAVK